MVWDCCCIDNYITIHQYGVNENVDLNVNTWYFLNMEKKRLPYNTTLDADLIKQLKFLCVEENKRHNDLLEEAIRDLLNKYKNQKVNK